MTMINIFNQGFAFIAECLALYAWATLAYAKFDQRTIKLLAVVLILAVLIGIWGAFFAPKASYRLPVIGLFVGKLIILLAPSHLYLLKGKLVITIIWAIGILLHLFLAVHFKNI